ADDVGARQRRKQHDDAAYAYPDADAIALRRESQSLAVLTRVSAAILAKAVTASRARTATADGNVDDPLSACDRRRHFRLPLLNLLQPRYPRAQSASQNPSPLPELKTRRARDGPPGYGRQSYRAAAAWPSSTPASSPPRGCQLLSCL